MIAEEIEIVVTAKVTEALKEFKKIVPEVKSTMNQVQNEVNKVDFKTIKSETSKVKKAIKDAFDPNDVSALKNIGLEKASNSTKNLTDEQIRLKAEMDKVGRAMLDLNADSAEYNQLMEKMHTLNRQYQGIESPKGTPIQTPSTDTSNISPSESSLSIWDKLVEKIKNFKSQFNFEPLKQQIAQIKNLGNFLSTESTNNELNLVNYKISEIQEKLEQAKNGEVHLSTKDALKLEVELDKLNEKKKKLEEQSKGGSFFSKIGSAISGIISKASKLPGLFKKSGNSVNSMSKGLKVGLKNVLKYAGALFGLRSIYNILRNSASAWLSSSNAQAKQLSANIEYMKYAMGSVFAPVIEYVINLVYKLMKAIQSVVYAFSRVNIFAKATASSMNSTSKSASKTSKSLAGIHSEINNISSGDDSSGSDTTSPSFDLSEMENAPSKILDAIQNGDWSSLGSLIAEKLNNALASIPWDKIKNTAKNIGTNIANFLNGFIGTTDWNQIGNTIAQGINTALNLVNGFITTFDWSGTGTAIGNTINGFTQKFDWDKLADTITGGLNGAVDTATKTLETTDWDELGQGIGKTIGRSIVKIDWVNIGKLIVKSFGSIHDMLAGIGQGIVDGIFEGIGERIGKLTLVKIVELLFTPIMDKFKTAWGIHSPSTKMAEMGGYIVDGLVSGLSNIWDKVKTIFYNLKNNIVNKVTEVVDNIKTKVATLWTNLKTGAKGAWEGIKNVFSSVATFFKNTFSNAWTAVKNVFSKGGTVFAGIKEGITSTFKTIVNGLIDGINKVVSVPFKAINTALSKIKNIEILGAKPFSFISTISIPTIPHLATGNVAYEETLAVFGEYAGAKSNPEITTPQNIMRETFRNELQDFANSSQNNSNGLSKLIIQFGSTQVALEMEKLIQKARRQNGTATATI